MTVFEFVPSDIPERVMEYIREHGKATPNEISEHLDISITRAYRILKSEHGRNNLVVIPVPTGRKNRMHYAYAIPEDFVSIHS